MIRATREGIRPRTAAPLLCTALLRAPGAVVRFRVASEGAFETDLSGTPAPEPAPAPS